MPKWIRKFNKQVACKLKDDSKNKEKFEKELGWDNTKRWQREEKKENRDSSEVI